MILGFSDRDLPLLFPFAHVQDSPFSNYAVLGWVVFILVGVLGCITFLFILRKKKNFPYLILVEGIFISSMICAHAIYGGFHILHLIMLIPGTSLIVLGIVQAPREF